MKKMKEDIGFAGAAGPTVLEGLATRKVAVLLPEEDGEAVKDPIGPELSIEFLALAIKGEEYAVEEGTI